MGVPSAPLTMTTYIMSTTIIPGGAWGRWEMDSIDAAQAALMVYPEGPGYQGWTSAVGHESTAAVLSDLLGVNIPQNRITVAPVPGDRFLCFRLLGRPAEGAILDRPTLESIGYEFALMRYIG